MFRSACLLLAIFAAVPMAQAQVPTRIKIGMLTDMSGPFSDQVGAGSVAGSTRKEWTPSLTCPTPA